MTGPVFVRAEVVALAVLLLAPAPIGGAQAPASAWSQAGGNAQRTGTFESESHLDVLGTLPISLSSDLDQLNFGLDSPLVNSAGRLVGIAWNVDLSCWWVVIADGAISSEPPFSCPDRGHVVASLADGTILACFDGAGGDGALRAFDARFEPTWEVQPSQPFMREWTRCGGGAVDEAADIGLILFWRRDLNGNELVAFRPSTGDVIWSRAVPLTAADSRIAQPPVGTPADMWLPRVATRTEGGWVVSGALVRRIDTAQNDFEVGLAILGDDSTIRGSYTAGLTHLGRPLDDLMTVDPRVPTHGSLWAVGESGRAAMVLGRSLLIADVATGQARSIAFTSPDTTPASQPPGPVIAGGLLLVPWGGSVTAYAWPSVTEEPVWMWSGPAGGSVQEVITRPSRDMLVLMREPGDDGPTLALHFVDLRDGVSLRALPLGEPLGDNTPNTSLGGALDRFVPLGDEVYVASEREVARLGRSPIERRPNVGLSSAYPRVGENIDLTLGEPSSDGDVTVFWGDGAFENATSGGTARHAYGAPGAAQLAVTRTFPDGTTATTIKTIEVGGTPPRDLTAIQRAFEPEYQNYTLFLLGLAFTGGGVLFAALLRRQRHSRLAEEERKLRKVIDASLLEPTQGLAALETHRAHLKDQHTRRRLDDAQYGLLDQRCVRAMKSARYRLLGSALNKLSPHFRRLLDTALEDGQVTTGEMAALVAALEEESALSTTEREKMRALLAAWAR